MIMHVPNHSLFTKFTNQSVLEVLTVFGCVILIQQLNKTIIQLDLDYNNHNQCYKTFKKQNSQTKFSHDKGP